MTTIVPRIEPPAPVEGQFFFGTAIDQAIDEFSAAAVRASSLDPITTEVVRLRCARYHDCRLCQALRYEPALSSGFDSSLAAKIDHFEDSDLAPALKAALRLTDAAIRTPVVVDAELATAVRAHYSEEQIAELLNDIIKWSFQKVLVALQLDAPVGPGLTELSFDGRGDPVFGATLEA